MERKKKVRKKSRFRRIYLKVVPGAGLEPARVISSLDFKSNASTDFATRAIQW